MKAKDVDAEKIAAAIAAQRKARNAAAIRAVAGAVR